MTMLTTAQIDDLLRTQAEHNCEGYGRHKICVRIVAVADLPTRFGHFQIFGFWNNRDDREHVAIMHGNVFGRVDVPTRLHSACLTGDALGSLRCDCRDQLQTSLETMNREEFGLVLYLQQEGRGIGLLNKLKAYQLQDRGLDTVEANLALGFRDDEREYSIAAHMLDSLEVESIRLFTNNPRKVRMLRQYGVEISERVPLAIPPNDFNRFYLQTKASKSGHYLDTFGKPHLPEQGEQVQVDDPSSSKD